MILGPRSNPYPNAASAVLLIVAAGCVVTKPPPPGTKGVFAPRPAADMIDIPGGTFLMGSMTGAERERPVRRVTVGSFALDRTEVTVAAYATCVASEACTEPRWFCGRLNASRPEHPVNCVSWEQAHAYCAWRGARLPTEAEWEYAARGPEGRTYSWGEEAPSTQVCRHPVEYTCPVDAHPADVSPFGVLGMSGNVAEWVSDRFGPYPEDAETNPVGPAEGGTHVFRGGSWFFRDAGEFRTARRGRLDPWASDNTLGFRCAADRGPGNHASEGATGTNSRGGPDR